MPDELRAEVMSLRLLVHQMRRKTLSPREMFVILWRIDDEKVTGCEGVKTFREIGEELGVSGGRARQIHQRAIRKLRISSSWFVGPS